LPLLKIQLWSIQIIHFGVKNITKIIVASEKASRCNHEGNIMLGKITTKNTPGYITHS